MINNLVLRPVHETQNALCPINRKIRDAKVHYRKKLREHLELLKITVPKYRELLMTALRVGSLNVLMKLSAKLSERFGRGFSVDNLQNMHRFFKYIPYSGIYEKPSRKLDDEQNIDDPIRQKASAKLAFRLVTG